MRRVAGELSSDELRREVAELQDRLDEIRRHLRSADVAAELPPGDLALFCCRVSGATMGFPLASVEEVVPIASLIPVPEAPPWVPGVLNLRGGAVTVVDVAARLQKAERRPALNDLIVVCCAQGRRYGLIVQEVLDVLHSRREALRDAGSGTEAGPYLLGVLGGSDPVLVVGVDALVRSSRIPEQAAT